MKTRLANFDGRLEQSDDKRLEKAVESIRESFPTETWAELSPAQRHWHLDRVGRELTHAYGTGEPMLLERPLTETKESVLLGVNNDERFTVTINEKLLESTDPAKALKVFFHEWRHSFQNEQAHRFNSGFRHLCQDEYQSEIWSKNLENYVQPEVGRFAEYSEQPVEVDAENFSHKLVSQIIGR